MGEGGQVDECEGRSWCRRLLGSHLPAILIHFECTIALVRPLRKLYTTMPDQPRFSRGPTIRLDFPLMNRFLTISVQLFLYIPNDCKSWPYVCNCFTPY